MFRTMQINVNSLHPNIDTNILLKVLSGREIAPDTGANATKFFTLATKSWKLVAKLATKMLYHNHT